MIDGNSGHQPMIDDGPPERGARGTPAD